MTLSITTLPLCWVLEFWVSSFIYCYAEWNYAECCYAYYPLSWVSRFIYCYAEGLFWVSLHWVSFHWMSLCWVSNFIYLYAEYHNAESLFVEYIILSVVGPLFLCLCCCGLLSWSVCWTTKLECLNLAGPTLFVSNLPRFQWK